MSRASFPRPEHSALLREKIHTALQARGLPLELTDRGIDQYRCCYRFGFRRFAAQEWTDLAIHFQVAERLESSSDDAELEHILILFLERYFAAEPVKHRHRL